MNIERIATQHIHIHQNKTLSGIDFAYQFVTISEMFVLFFIYYSNDRIPKVEALWICASIT